MPASPEVEELVREIDLLKTVVSVLVAEHGSAVYERLLALYPDGTEMKERLLGLIDVTR